MDNREVAKLMREAALYVMPSRFEAFGISFIEAMASGLPIIGRDQFEAPYFVQEGSGLLMKSYPEKADEVADLVHKMKGILSQPQYLKDAEERADKIKDLYTWDSVVDRMSTIMPDL